MVNDEWVVSKILEFDKKTNPATINEPGVITIGEGLYVDSLGKLAVTPFYGFQIDMAISNPAACITYTGAAATMSQAERKAWAYSKVTPTVVKNGEINYKLKRDNLALKEDGVTASNLTGTDGDVCASISPLWFKISKAGKVISVNLSEYPQPGYVSAHKFGGVFKKFLHIGMFEATGDGSKSVYSTTEKPTVSKTLKAFRTAIHARNTGLAENLYNPMTYLTHTLFNALLVFAYGTLNSQSAVGQGLVSLSAASAVGKEALLTCGGEYGTADAGNDHVMALFVVNPWGNVWKFADGSMWNTNQFAVLTDQQDIYDIEGGWATKPEDWHVVTAGQFTNWSYITEFTGDAYAGFFPCATGGDSESYACDSAGRNDGERCCIVGGDWSHAAAAGAFLLYVADALAHSSALVGARLQILNLT